MRRLERSYGQPCLCRASLCASPLQGSPSMSLIDGETQRYLQPAVTSHIAIQEAETATVVVVIVEAAPWSPLASSVPGFDIPRPTSLLRPTLVPAERRRVPDPGCDFAKAANLNSTSISMLPSKALKDSSRQRSTIVIDRWCCAAESSKRWCRPARLPDYSQCPLLSIAR